MEIFIPKELFKPTKYHRPKAFEEILSILRNPAPGATPKEKFAKYIEGLRCYPQSQQDVMKKAVMCVDNAEFSINWRYFLICIELQHFIIFYHPYYLKYDNKSTLYPQICIEAVKQNGVALQYVPDKVKIEHTNLVLDALCHATKEMDFNTIINGKWDYFGHFPQLIRQECIKRFALFKEIKDRDASDNHINDFMTPELQAIATYSGGFVLLRYKDKHSRNQEYKTNGKCLTISENYYPYLKDLLSVVEKYLPFIPCTQQQTQYFTLPKKSSFIQMPGS